MDRTALQNAVKVIVNDFGYSHLPRFLDKFSLELTF